MQGISATLELENTDAPANYIVRLRGEQAGLRKAVLRVYLIQREEFLPSAHAMIFSFTVLVVVLLAFTKIGTEAETLVTVAFLSFFFVYPYVTLGTVSGLVPGLTVTPFDRVTDDGIPPSGQRPG